MGLPLKSVPCARRICVATSAVIPRRSNGPNVISKPFNVPTLSTELVDDPSPSERTRARAGDVDPREGLSGRHRNVTWLAHVRTSDKDEAVAVDAQRLPSSPRPGAEAAVDR